jgi:hypothetical protein
LAFINLLSLISSRPTKVYLNQWSSFWGPSLIKWHERKLRLLQFLLTPSDLLPRKMLRDKNSLRKKSDLPLPKRSQVLKRLAKLGTPPPNLSKLSTFHLTQMLYELESGEPG